MSNNPRNKNLVAAQQAQLRQKLVRSAQSSGGDEGSGYDALFRRRQQEQAQRKKQEQEQAQRKKQEQKLRQEQQTEELDVKELLNKEIYKPDNTIVDDTSYKFQINNPDNKIHSQVDVNTYGISDKYFFIDSNNKDITSISTNGKFIFDINKLVNLQPIENIIEIEITPFYFEKRPIPDLNFMNNAPPIYYNRTISMLIEEFESQSIVASNNRKFHFVFNVIDDVITPNVRVRLEPTQSKFVFTKPIRSVDQLTLSFSNPLEHIILKNDIQCGYFQSGRTGCPIITGTSGPPNPNEAIFWLQDVKSFRELIKNEKYVIRFTDVSMVQFNSEEFKDATVQYMLRPEGHIVTFVQTSDAFCAPTGIVPPPPYDPPVIGNNFQNYFYFKFENFSPPLDDTGTFFTTSVPIEKDTFQKCFISIESRRINFTVRLRTLQSVQTNRITAV